MFRCKSFVSIEQNGNLLSQSSKKLWFMSVNSAFNWKKKLLENPIYISKTVEKLSPQEMYLKNFQSSKGVSADVMKSLNANLSAKEMVTAEGVKEYLNVLKLRANLLSQRYLDKRVDILGPDLAAAHFVVHRGGKVRFKGQTKGIERNEDYEYELPFVYDINFVVEEIDVSGMNIMYDGLQNFDGLKFLKTFKVCKCRSFDDWCMDRISSQFSDTLTELDISHCPHITGKGLEVIVRLRKLKLLKLYGFDHVENAKLISLLLEDCKPELKIEGLNI